MSEEILSDVVTLQKLIIYRDHFVYAPSQREMALHCNTISHWLGTYTEWSLNSGYCLVEQIFLYKMFFMLKTF